MRQLEVVPAMRQVKPSVGETVNIVEEWHLRVVAGRPPHEPALRRPLCDTPTVDPYEAALSIVPHGGRLCTTCVNTLLRCLALMTE